jgi:hypothetical protein
MKSLGLILVLSVGIIVMMLTLIPVRTSVQVFAEEADTSLGKARVGQIIVRNDGWFTQRVRLPELTACIGEQEVPLDGWTVSGDTIVRGVGQPPAVVVSPGEVGKVYLMASDVSFAESITLHYRKAHFSCLDAGARVE